MLNRIARRLVGRGAILVASALLVSACNVDNTLQVPDPDVSRPTDIVGKAGLPTLFRAGVGDFQVAFAGTGNGGSNEGLVNMTGLFTDEFFFTETYPTRVQVDRRAIDPKNSTMAGIFFDVQRARQSTFRAESAYAVLSPNDSLRSEALSLEGYTWIFLAEDYCSGVAVTKMDANANIIPGQPLTTQQVLDSALDRFSKALTVAKASGSGYLANLARVGYARALIFKGNANLAEAADTAANVTSPSFVYRIFSSSNTTRQNNGVFELQWNEGRWTVGNREGGVGLPFRNGDPRTPVADAGPGFDQTHEVFGTLKYADRDASTVLADYTEAQLIIAESQLASNYGGAGGTLEILNNLRAAAGMTALAPAVGAQAQLLQLFTERAYWMYGTVHRLGDLRRLVRPVASGGYGLAQNSVWPNGAYTGGQGGGGAYGTDVNFPIPLDEINSNPNVKGCLDRNP